MAATQDCRDSSLFIGQDEIKNPVCIPATDGEKTFISGIVSLLLIAAAFLAFMMLLWGGVQYIISGGDKEGTAKAKARITYAIVGLVVAFLALVIMRILGNILSFDLF